MTKSRYVFSTPATIRTGGARRRIKTKRWKKYAAAGDGGGWGGGRRKNRDAGRKEIRESRREIKSRVHTLRVPRRIIVVHS